ncbi:MAG: restriction endonuclease [bacterium]|nr:restriction endonuclease [bacterium]
MDNFIDIFTKQIINVFYPFLVFIYLLIFILFIFKFIINLILKKIEKNKLKKIGINDIDNLDGLTFEKYLEVLFKNMGYKVIRTPYVQDYGADLILEKDDIKTLVQAKRYKSKVGVKAIQEIVAAKGYYKADYAMVITNSYFTFNAKKLAKENNVELWNRKKLIKNIIQYLSNDNKQTSVNNELLKDDLQTDINFCFICNKRLTDKEIDYCLGNTNIFKGKTYCYNCQKKV